MVKLGRGCLDWHIIYLVETSVISDNFQRSENSDFGLTM